MAVVKPTIGNTSVFPRSLGTITVELQLSTSVGGPISLGEAEIDVQGKGTLGHDEVVLEIDHAALRHEIANALIEAANAIDSQHE